VTIIYDDGPVRRHAKRDAAPQIVPTDVPTALPDLTPTSAEMSAVEAPGPSSCGESGSFTLNFDDTVVGSDGDQILVVNGLANPYHHLFYANGYTYVPDKWEPYPAVSQPNIAMFLPLTGRLLPNQPFTGSLLPGELGAGPRASVSAYWFNAYSGYFGCALSGVSWCVLRISGYRYDSARGRGACGGAKRDAAGVLGVQELPAHAGRLRRAVPGAVGHPVQCVYVRTWDSASAHDGRPAYGMVQRQLLGGDPADWPSLARVCCLGRKGWRGGGGSL
jgi:hypothetical protein